MANAPVLERTEKREYGYKSAVMANEEDLARIKRNYAMLINPNTKLDDLLDRPAEQPAQKTDVFSRKQEVYLVKGARADSDLFRADSIINRRAAEVASSDATEEEENEDLRPTPTTIQYRTAGIKNSEETVGNIRNAGAKKYSVLNKKEKIIIAVTVSVIIALLALVIINSVIISGLNSDLTSLQRAVGNVKNSYTDLNDRFTEMVNDIGSRVAEFANNNGMIR